MVRRSLFALCVAWLASWSAAAASDAETTPGGRDASAGLTVEALYRHVEGATVAILLHEMGHAFVDAYGLPAVGPEEDVADQFASVFMAQQAAAMGFGDDFADSYYEFHARRVEEARDAAGRRLLSAAAMWDEHDFSERRGLATLCFMYGATSGLRAEDLDASPTMDAVMLVQRSERYRERLSSLGVPPERLDKCVADYARESSAWNTLLGPWLRPPDERAALAEKLEAMGRPGMDAGFRVTYAPLRPRPLRRSDQVFQQFADIFDNERLRYDVVRNLAIHVNLWFKPPPSPGGPYSIDIFSGPCGEINAFYLSATASITICSELLDSIAGDHIAYKTGMTSQEWWQAQPGASDERTALAGRWLGPSGQRIDLHRNGFYEWRRMDGDDAPAVRGIWSVEAGTIAFLETERDGRSCFNPVCAMQPGNVVAERDLDLLLGGLVPAGPVKGVVDLPACRVDLARHRRNTPEDGVRHDFDGSLLEMACAADVPRMSVAGDEFSWSGEPGAGGTIERLAPDGERIEDVMVDPPPFGSGKD